MAEHTTAIIKNLRYLFVAGNDESGVVLTAEYVMAMPATTVAAPMIIMLDFFISVAFNELLMNIYCIYFANIFISV